MTKGTLNRSYRIKFRASKCGCAGIGRQAGLKIRWAYARGGSSPPTRTIFLFTLSPFGLCSTGAAHKRRGAVAPSFKKLRLGSSVWLEVYGDFGGGVGTGASERLGPSGPRG